MAGEWIPIRVDLHEDPAVMQMAELLEVREEVVVGYLVKVWCWVSRQCHADVTHGVTLASLGRIVNLPGFPEIMAQVGWLEATEDGIRIPNFDRWFSQSAKRRLLATRRKQAQRSNETKKRVTQMSRSERDKNATREDLSSKKIEDEEEALKSLRTEDILKTARSFRDRLYGQNNGKLADSTKRVLWVFAALVQARMFSEAEVELWIEAAEAPTVKKRAAYLQSCLAKGLEDRGSSWGKVLAACPERPGKDPAVNGRQTP